MVTIRDKDTGRYMKLINTTKNVAKVVCPKSGYHLYDTYEARPNHWTQRSMKRRASMVGKLQGAECPYTFIKGELTQVIEAVALQEDDHLLLWFPHHFAGRNSDGSYTCWGDNIQGHTSICLEYIKKECSHVPKSRQEAMNLAWLYEQAYGTKVVLTNSRNYKKEQAEEEATEWQASKESKQLFTATGTPLSLSQINIKKVKTFTTNHLNFKLAL